MLIVERIGESKKMCSDMVKCPLCKRGRLCDKPNHIKVKTIVGRLIRNSKETVSVIVKCPSCGQKFNIYLSK